MLRKKNHLNSMGTEAWRGMIEKETIKVGKIRNELKCSPRADLIGESLYVPIFYSGFGVGVGWWGYYAGESPNSKVMMLMFDICIFFSPTRMTSEL